MEKVGGRRAEARLTARELVEALEENAAIDNCLMKAQRLARMLRDPDAHLWLDHETRGYPQDFALSRLTKCIHIITCCLGHFSLFFGDIFTGIDC